LDAAGPRIGSRTNPPIPAANLHPNIIPQPPNSHKSFVPVMAGSWWRVL
jgi:hypothetical protein